MKSKGLTKLKKQVKAEIKRWREVAERNKLWDDGSRGGPYSLVWPPEECTAKAYAFEDVLKMIEKIEKEKK